MRIILTIKAVLNYLKTHLIDLVWVRIIRFSDGTEMDTVPVGNNLYDIKLLSQAIADKGFACMCHTTRQDLSKEDVPTLYNDILEKYNNVEKAELPWTDGVSADGYIGKHNGTIYRMSGNTISYSSNPKTVNFTNLVTISGINYVNDFTFRCYNNYMLVFYGDSYDNTCNGIIVVSYDGTYFNIALSTEYYVAFEKEDYIYITDYTNRRLYRLPNTHYNNLPQSLELVVEYTDSYQLCTDFVYHNGLYYIVNSLYQIYPANPSYTVIGVHTTTDLSDLSKYSWNKYHTTITSTGYGYEAKIVKAGNRLIVMAYGNNSYSCSYSDDGFDTGTDFTFGGSNRNYWLTLEDNILFFTYLERYRKGGSTATFYKEHIITFNTIDMSYVDTNFGEKTSNANICKLVYTDNDYVIVGNNIKYSGLAPVKYSDVINGTTIYYYKYNDWKICIAGENGTNDVNLDTVYNFLGYLNYWRLDTTVGAETVSIPRDKRLWSMMFVGDNFQDDNLPVGNYVLPISYIVEKYDDGNGNGYILYNDNRIEIYGIHNFNSSEYSATISVTLPKTMRDNKYNISIDCGRNTDNACAMGYGTKNKTTTGFDVQILQIGSSDYCDYVLWSVKGYIANS